MNTPITAQHSAGEAPAIVLPDPASIFLARAERFDALALHHSLGEWLGFVGRLSRAQHKALEAAGADLTPPAAETLERARKRRMPPIGVATFQRPIVWHDILRNIVGQPRAAGHILDRVTADVTVTNPSHFAVALKYERGKDQAPVILAKGENRFAQRIKALGAEHGVPTVENKPVARLLFAMGKVGETIPAELYAAVAGILAVVYRTHRYYFYNLKSRRLTEGHA